MKIFKRKSYLWRKMAETLDQKVLEEAATKTIQAHERGSVIRSFAALIIPGYTVRRFLNWTFQNETNDPAIKVATYAVEAGKVALYALCAQPTYEAISNLL